MNFLNKKKRDYKKSLWHKKTKSLSKSRIKDVEEFFIN